MGVQKFVPLFIIIEQNKKSRDNSLQIIVPGAGFEPACPMDTRP